MMSSTCLHSDHPSDSVLGPLTIGVLLLIWGLFLCTYTIRVRGYVSEDISIEPIVSISSRPLVRLGLLSNLLPSYSTLFVRAQDLEGARLDTRVYQKQDGTESRKYALYFDLKPLRRQAQVSPNTEQWLQARQGTLVRETFQYANDEYSDVDVLSELKHKVNTFIATYRSNPQKPQYLVHEEVHVSPWVLIALGAILAGIAQTNVWKSETIFDARHMTLYLRQTMGVGVYTTTKVISFSDIIMFRVVEEMHTDDRRTWYDYKIQLQYNQLKEDDSQDEVTELDEQLPSAGDDHKQQPLHHFDLGSSGTNEIKEALEAARSGQSKYGFSTGAARHFKQVSQTRWMFAARTWSTAAAANEHVRLINEWLEQASQHSALHRSDASSGSSQSEASAANASDSGSAEGKHCVICYSDKPPSMLFLPCRHLLCCPSCASAISTCPLCRGPISAMIDVKFS